MINRQLTLLHFNDVYNIESGSREPVGGAARFAYKVKSYTNENPLVLFSGDAFNPSIMSTITLGKQMVPVLNSIGVHVAAVGNHDLDYGVDNMARLCQECNFPWLMANVLDIRTGEPLGGVGKTKLLDWQGVKVGIMGLVEGEWIQTLSTVDPSAVTYIDFVEAGRSLAAELKAAGAELVIALTHMRQPNDILLAQSVPDIHLVLGGHDHGYFSQQVQPHGNWVVKSGTDFRELSRLVLRLAPGAAGPQVLCCERLTITAAVPEDEQTAAVVAEYGGLMGERMQEVIGHSATDLEGRFEAVRTRETNLGNLVCDVFRMATEADVAILNSGSLRSDTVHPAGPLTMNDFVSILPMVDATVVVEASGQQLLEALENGVSALPKQEGRFPQVSGISFAYDSRQPPGKRVVAGSVMVHGAPLQLSQFYRLATKSYLADGKDGYDCLKGCRELVPEELCPTLPTIVRNHFRRLAVLNAMSERAQVGRFAHHWRRSSEALEVIAGHGVQQQVQQHEGGVCVREAVSHRYVVAPMCDGRMVDVAGQQQLQQQ